MDNKEDNPDQTNNTDTDQKVDFKDFINKRLEEAKVIIDTAKTKLETITDPLLLEKIATMAYLYYNACPAAALGKAFDNAEQALVFSTLVAAWFSKSGELLLNKQMEEKGSDLLVPKKSGLILPGQ